jgi:hypothetical protein
LRPVIEGVLFLVAGLGGVGAIAYSLRGKMLQAAPEKCRHRRWTKWKVEQTKLIHIYPDPDSGKELPDRVDAYMSRECIRCGKPEARTVRGIDSTQYK